MRVLVTFAVSVASFHLVERPIRQGTFVRQWRAWLAVPAAVGVVVVAVGRGDDRDDGGGQHRASRPDQPAPASTTTTDGWLGPARAPDAPPVRVLLFGDSVALTLGIGLGRPAVPGQVRLRPLATRGSSAAGW